MKELDNVHQDRFYTDLVMNGKLIEERVNGTNEDGETQLFYCFDDAVDEAEYEGFTLDEYGEAYYYKEGKVYLASVYLENNEASGINELESEEIVQLIAELIVSNDDDEEWFYEQNEWAKEFK